MPDVNAPGQFRNNLGAVCSTILNIHEYKGM